MTIARRMLLAAVLAGLFAGPAGAQGTVSKFQVDGLDVLLKRVENNPVVSTALYLKGGSAVLTPEQAGIEPFLFTVATRGTRNYPKEKLNAALAHMGTDLGVEAQFDYTALTMRCIREDFDASWDIFADVVRFPTIDSTEVERVRQQTLTALKQEVENPETDAFRVANNLLYAGHPYEIYYKGTQASVGGFTRAELLAYHQKTFVKARMLLVVVGNVDRADLESKVQKTLASLPEGTYTQPALPAPPHGNTAELKLVPRAIPTTYAFGTHPAPGIVAPDFYPYLVATSILSNRLFEAVRTKRNLTYNVSSGVSQRRSNYGYVQFNAVDPDSTLKVIFGQIKRLKSSPVSAKDLTGQISLFITGYFLRNETAASQNALLARYEIVGDGWQESEHFVDNLRKVTPADVQRVAKEYMQHYHFGVVGDSTKVDRALFTSR